MPVWEISGAEFSQAQVHTANGISIRFPRVTKIRDDKDWATATSLTELQVSEKKIIDIRVLQLNLVLGNLKISYFICFRIYMMHQKKPAI